MSYFNIITDEFTTITINGTDIYITPRRNNRLDDIPEEPPRLVRSTHVPEINIISNNFANHIIEPLEYTNSVVRALNFSDEEDSDDETLPLSDDEDSDDETWCLSDEDDEDEEEEPEFDKASLTSESAQSADDDDDSTWCPSDEEEDDDLDSQATMSDNEYFTESETEYEEDDEDDSDYEP